VKRRRTKGRDTMAACGQLGNPAMKRQRGQAVTLTGSVADLNATLATIVYRGAINAYANSAKEQLLGVPKAMLETYGAVSEEVAGAMAEGARRAAGATWGLGITGIAGPGGGTEEKPVGTVHLALAGPRATEALARLIRGLTQRYLSQPTRGSGWLPDTPTCGAASMG
jgi:PncC family amidohydrolase